MVTWLTIIGGALLGVLSRVEETTPFSAGVSSNGMWVAAAFAAGALHSELGAARAALAGIATLTVANLAYYACVAFAEPGVDLSAVAGPPARWFVLGLLSGALFAVCGRLWARTRGAVRVVAVLPLTGVVVAECITALLGGPPADGVGLAAGAALPVASGTDGRARLLGAALSCAVVGVALTGRLEALLP